MKRPEPWIRWGGAALIVILLSMGALLGCRAGAWIMVAGMVLFAAWFPAVAILSYRKLAKISKEKNNAAE